MKTEKVKLDIMKESVLTRNQKATRSKEIIFDGAKHQMKVEIRFDDECGNGHNTFAITADIKKNGRTEMCGCCHEEIIKNFPELEKYIKWHGCTSEGPLYYIGNTLYLAGDKDYNGRRKGEVSSYDESLKFGNFPMSFKYPIKFIEWVLKQNVPNDLFIEEVEHNHKPGDYEFSPKYTFRGYVREWHYCPFDTGLEAQEFIDACAFGKPIHVKIPSSYSEGKEPELDAARNIAIWQEATIEQLNNKESLIEHLKEIMPLFRADMEELGFTW